MIYIKKIGESLVQIPWTSGRIVGKYRLIFQNTTDNAEVRVKILRQEFNPLYYVFVIDASALYEGEWEYLLRGTYGAEERGLARVENGREDMTEYKKIEIYEQYRNE